MKPKRFEVKISLENDAFQPEPEAEIARILRNLADRVERGVADGFRLHDENGNTVGSAAFGKASFRRV